MIKLQTDGHAVGARARFCLTEKAMSIGRDCEGERGDAFSPDPYMRTMHVKHLALFILKSHPRSNPNLQLIVEFYLTQ